MTYQYRTFPFTEVLTLISGRMLTTNDRNNIDMLYDFVQFMRNDENFCEEARAGAPRLTMLHFLEVVEEVVEDLKAQFPDLENYEIPAEFAKDFTDPAINFDYWQYVTEVTHGHLLVRSLDRY